MDMENLIDKSDSPLFTIGVTTKWFARRHAGASWNLVGFGPAGKDEAERLVREFGWEAYSRKVFCRVAADVAAV